MPARRKLPSVGALQKMVDQGMTHAQIAAKISEETDEPVGRSAVSAELSRAGMTNPRRFKDEIPWRVSAKHSHSGELWMLRIVHRKKHNMPVSPEEERRFAGWKRYLAEHDAVVRYDPKTEQGFFRVPRYEDDEEFICPHTTEHHIGGGKSDEIAPEGRGRYQVIFK